MPSDKAALRREILVLEVLLQVLLLLFDAGLHCCAVCSPSTPW
jgi:hypothetical protein